MWAQNQLILSVQSTLIYEPVNQPPCSLLAKWGQSLVLYETETGVISKRDQLAIEGTELTRKKENHLATYSNRQTMT